MWLSSGMMSPVGSWSNFGVSNSWAPSSGAPVSRSRPNIRCCSVMDTRSQNSTSIRISRTTWYEPPVVQDGSPPPVTHSSRSATAGSVTSGLDVPSLKPMWLRGFRWAAAGW